MIRHSRPLLAAALLLAPAGLCPAVITVTGLTDRSYHLDTVTFTIVNDAGFTFTAAIDGASVSPAAAITENRFGYHELFVTKTPNGGGAAENLTLKFIVKDGARGGSSNTYPEAGLPRWTPLRSIDAPDAVLDATTWNIITPSSVPAGFPLPVVVRLTDGSNAAMRIMGTMQIHGAAGPASCRIFRGAGSKVVKSPATGGAQTVQFALGSRTASRQVSVVAAPAWQTLTGAAGGTSFPPGSFIDMTGNVTVAAGSTLTFGEGCVIRCAQGVEFDAQGTILLNGTVANPILFAPAANAVWGGIWVHGATARIEARFTLLTGGGANPSWISQKGFHAHKSNQPIITWTDNATGFVEDCAIVDNPNSQVFHGEDANLTGNPFQIRRGVFQRAISGGQISDCNLVWDANHLVELPRDETSYTENDATDDFDGLYIDGGLTVLSNSVIGWTKDDGNDSGSGNTSNVTMTNCWFESCYHEAIAWSEGGTRTLRNTVVMNSGQGLECGFTGQGAGSPVVDARGLYSTGNAHGLRYGDNYDWDYSGKFDVHDSLSLFNRDDVFGRYWGEIVGTPGVTWNYIGNNRASNAYMHLEALPAQTLGPAIVSTPQAEHPTIPTWDPSNAAHLALLEPFLTLPNLPSGFGIGQEDRLFARAAYGGSVIVRLDRPTNVARPLPWKLIGKTSVNAAAESTLLTGTLTLVAGQQAAAVSLPALPGAGSMSLLALTFDDIPNCVCTGYRSVVWADLNLPAPPQAPPDATFITRGAAGWKYLAQATAAPANWTASDFNDAAWPSGPAPLQTAEAALGGTAVPANPNNSNRPFNTVYFRRAFTVADKTLFTSLTINCMRDDGVVIHLNGQELKRSNMPEGVAIEYNTEASGTPASESAYITLAPLSVAILQNGTNVLAVEVHQFPIPSPSFLNTSSDMRMDLDLFGVQAAPAVPVAFTTGQAGNESLLFWTEPGAILQTNPMLDGNWQDWPDVRPPFAIVPDQDRMFFRLKRP